MNPLRSTSTKTSVHAGGPAARIALTRPYEADLEHFLSQTQEDVLSTAGRDAPVVQSLDLLRRARRIVREAITVLATSMGAAFSWLVQHDH